MFIILIGNSMFKRSEVIVLCIMLFPRSMNASCPEITAKATSDLAANPKQPDKAQADPTFATFGGSSMYPLTFESQSPFVTKEQIESFQPYLEVASEFNPCKALKPVVKSWKSYKYYDEALNQFNETPDAHRDAFITAAVII